MNDDEFNFEETTIGRAVIELIEVQESLGQDVLVCTKMLEQEDSQFWRRTLVRTSFALIEGVVHRMKHLAFEFCSYEKIPLSRAEVAMLQEEGYELNDKGEAISKVSYMHITKNVKFAFKVLARAYSVNNELKVDDAGWDNFKKALKIRDRLMHPKSSSDLIVNDADVSTVDKAVGWFGQHAHELQTKMVASLNERTEALKAGNA
jgi:recombinational DNA repair protein (RecF pathway)